MSSLAGRLLIAEPMMSEENFERTVILMIEHNDEGAVGVVVNRPSELDASDLVPEWSHLVVEPQVVFVGGPVSQTGVIGLGRRDDLATPIAGWGDVVGRCGTINLHLDPFEVGAGIAGVRLFAGFSGWGAGQLEGELAAGAWYVVDAREDDAFTADPRRLWHDVLRRQPSELSLLADFPPHPSLN
jgi:putative transcriptional regulator